MPRQSRSGAAFQVYLPQKMLEQVKAIAKSKGRKQTEEFRRAMAVYLRDPSFWDESLNYEEGVAILGPAASADVPRTQELAPTPDDNGDAPEAKPGAGKRGARRKKAT